MRSFFCWSALLGLALLATNVQGQATTYTCPIGGVEFSADLPRSADHTGQNLDFKLTGEGVVSPAAVPICPDNGFIIYRDDFSEGEISSLTSYVLSAEYQEMVDVHTPYYRLAKIQDFLGRPVLEVAFTYLRASWEVDTDRARYEPYARVAASGMESYLVDANRETADFFTSHVLLAELKRRVGDFAGAKAALDAVKHHDTASKPYPSRIMIELYKLIAGENREPHHMPR